MPKRAPTVCARPGCPALTAGTYCPTHTAETQRNASRQRRAEQGTQVYDTHAWQVVRHRYRRDHPHCRHPDCTEPTAHVDHIVPRRLLLAAGVTEPDDARWLQPLCEPHHNAKTQRTDVPLLHRLDQGDDPTELAEEALSQAYQGWGHTPKPDPLHGVWEASRSPES